MTILFIVIIGLLVYLVYRFFGGMIMVSNEEMYKQRSVTVMYKDGTIKINRSVYPVDKITGISTITEYNRNKRSFFTQIAVDDMRKPIHKIGIVGTHKMAEQYTQRICVALRKAGGPSFI